MVLAESVDEFLCQCKYLEFVHIIKFQYSVKFECRLGMGIEDPWYVRSRSTRPERRKKLLPNQSFSSELYPKREADHQASQAVTNETCGAPRNVDEISVIKKKWYLKDYTVCPLCFVRYQKRPMLQKGFIIPKMASLNSLESGRSHPFSDSLLLYFSWKAKLIFNMTGGALQRTKEFRPISVSGGRKICCHVLSFSCQPMKWKIFSNSFQAGLPACLQISRPISVLHSEIWGQMLLRSD